MKYGLVFSNIGEYSDARALADLAHMAEEAGWDGVFLWDTLQYVAEGKGVSDPWIALGAIAMRTERIKIGMQVAILPRRRPWKMARETITLDHLSNGRFILGVGAGDVSDQGFAAFGEELDAKKRAAMLDEGLEILQGLWSGKPFNYNGEHYHVDEITFLPTPVQTPRIPIWVGWTWPIKKPLERVIRFDGASPFTLKEDGSGDLSPAEVQQLKAILDERRTNNSPFDIVISGVDLFKAAQNEQGPAEMKAYADAGATWLLQRVWPDDDVKSIRELLRKGPPSIR